MLKLLDGLQQNLVRGWGIVQMKKSIKCCCKKKVNQGVLTLRGLLTRGKDIHPTECLSGSKAGAALDQGCLFALATVPFG